jgi:hypothetical protein
MDPSTGTEYKSYQSGTYSFYNKKSKISCAAFPLLSLHQLSSPQRTSDFGMLEPGQCMEVYLMNLLASKIEAATSFIEDCGSTSLPQN